MHIQYNNYTVKCVYIYRFFIHIARYFCIKTGSGDFITPPHPTPNRKPLSPHQASQRKKPLWKAWEQQHLYTWDPCFGKVSHRTTHLLWHIASRDFSHQHQEGKDVTLKSPLICFFLASVPLLNMGNNRSSPSRKSTKTLKLCHTSFVIIQ